MVYALSLDPLSIRIYVIMERVDIHILILVLIISQKSVI